MSSIDTISPHVFEKYLEEAKQQYLCNVIFAKRDDIPYPHMVSKIIKDGRETSLETRA